MGASPVTENDFWQNFYASGSNDQVTKTFYDNDAHLSQSNPTQTNRPVQINLRKRVASTVYLDRSGSGGTLEKRHATHYTYDVAGNVSSLWQEQTLLTAINDKHRFKQMDYEFDLISGKVNRVRYQQGYQDEINYLYPYDAENRLTGATAQRGRDIVEHGSIELQLSSGHQPFVAGIGCVWIGRGR